MSRSGHSGRFRGSRKRVARIRLSARDKWVALLLALFAFLAAVAGGWLGMNFHDE
jgi:hypothetical protein